MDGGVAEKNDRRPTGRHLLVRNGVSQDGLRRERSWSLGDDYTEQALQRFGEEGWG